MSKLFRCMDCGKEFDFDYSGLGLDIDPNDHEDTLIKLREYNKNLGVLTEINICNSCLQPLVVSKDSLLETKRNDLKFIEESSKKNIDTIKEKFTKEEKDFEEYSIKKEEEN